MAKTYPTPWDYGLTIWGLPHPLKRAKMTKATHHLPIHVQYSSFGCRPEGKSLMIAKDVSVP